MNVVKVILFIGIIAIVGCRDASISGSGNNTPTDESEKVTITLGTSFGMCQGYCRTSFTVSQEEMAFSQYSWIDSTTYPPLNSSTTLDSKEWDCLMTKLDMDTFEKLDAVIGCPDCADGGAEWIEIVSGGKTYKVTYEYGKEIPEIAELQEHLRRIRKQLAEPDNAGLYREWEWVSSTGGFAGMTHTPSGEGYTLRLVFNGNGHLELYQDNALKSRTPFWVTTPETIPGNTETRDMIIHGQDQPASGFLPCDQYFTIDGNTLTLEDNCADGYTSTFTAVSRNCK